MGLPVPRLIEVTTMESREPEYIVASTGKPYRPYHSPCKSCGAPHDSGQHACAYCLSPYDGASLVAQSFRGPLTAAQKARIRDSFTHAHIGLNAIRAMVLPAMVDGSFRK